MHAACVTIGLHATPGRTEPRSLVARCLVAKCEVWDGPAARTTTDVSPERLGSDVPKWVTPQVGEEQVELRSRTGDFQLQHPIARAAPGRASRLLE